MSKIDELELTKRNDTIESFRLVMPSVLEGEREAAHSKWYGYRFMTPYEATKLFAKLYRVGFKNYIRREVDSNLAERVQGLGTRIFGRPNRSLTEVWNARQRADLLGLPYELLIEFGFWFASNYRWKNAPRPAQIFGSLNSDIAWPIEFEKWLMQRLPSVVNRLEGIPQYRKEHYRAFPVQDEFRSYLLETLEESEGNWAWKLERQCLTTQHLPLHLAMRSVPKGGRENVVRHLRSEIPNYGKERETTPLNDLELAPACYGIPGAYSANAKLCLECPLFARCAGAAQSVTDFMTDKHGSLSPLATNRLFNRREKTSARVRNHRRNRELMKAAVTGVY